MFCVSGRLTRGVAVGVPLVGGWGVIGAATVAFVVHCVEVIFDYNVLLLLLLMLGQIHPESVSCEKIGSKLNAPYQLFC